MVFLRLRHILKLIITPFLSAKNQRYLLKEIVKRDIKGRFAGSVAGTFWTLLNPFFNIIVYIILFSLVLRINVTIEETGTDSFAVYFLTGYFPWLLFSDGLNRSVGILLDQSNLITKVVFPVELLPASTVITAFVTNILGMLIFFLYLIYLGYFNITWGLILLYIPVQMLMTLGISYFLSGLCIFIRDTREILGIILMVWFYATPILYPISLIPEEFHVYRLLNPMDDVIVLYRNALLIHQTDWMAFTRICGFSVCAYAIGALFFMRAKPAFGDVL